MVGRLYRCNVVGSHIVVSNRYPVMYLTVEYERPMVSGSLFQLFFSIDMDKEEKKRIKEKKHYVNRTFTGNWVKHLDCDEEFTQNYDTYLQELLDDEALKYFYHSCDEDIVTKRNTFTNEQITSWVDEYTSSERLFYDKIMMPQPDLEFKSLHKVRDAFVELCMSEKFHNFLCMAMKARELHRRKDYGIDPDDSGTYVIPKSVTKLDDVRRQMIEDDELILD